MDGKGISEVFIMKKLCVSSWSLHRELPHFLRKDTAAKISLTDFPKLCVEEFGVDTVELCQMHFLSTDRSYLNQVKKSLTVSGVKVANIPVDISTAAEPDAQKRREGFKIMKKWFTIAGYLGSPSIRVNSGKASDEDALQRAIDGYKELAKTAERTGLKLLIENHGGLSGNPDNIVKIIEEVESEYLGTCPDFGNFPPEIRYQALEKIAKYAAIAHAKTYDFDERGEETTIDLKRCVDILKKHGFKGHYSVEYEGEGDQREGVKKSLELLRKYL